MTGTSLTARSMRQQRAAVDVGQPEVEHDEVGPVVDGGLQAGHARRDAWAPRGPRSASARASAERIAGSSSTRSSCGTRRTLAATHGAGWSHDRPSSRVPVPCWRSSGWRRLVATTVGVLAVRLVAVQVGDSAVSPLSAAPPRARRRPVAVPGAVTGAPRRRLRQRPRPPSAQRRPHRPPTQRNLTGEPHVRPAAGTWASRAPGRPAAAVRHARRGLRARRAVRRAAPTPRSASRAAARACGCG